MRLLATRDHSIFGGKLRRRNFGLLRNIVIDWREIGVQRHIEKLLEAVDDEIALLVIIDTVKRPHDPAEVKRDAMGGIAIEREVGLSIT